MFVRYLLVAPLERIPEGAYWISTHLALRTLVHSASVMGSTTPVQHQINDPASPDMLTRLPVVVQIEYVPNRPVQKCCLGPPQRLKETSGSIQFPSHGNKHNRVYRTADSLIGLRTHEAYPGRFFRDFVVLWIHLTTTATRPRRHSGAYPTGQSEIGSAPLEEEVG
jgi:hypothetical protein